MSLAWRLPSQGQIEHWVSGCLLEGSAALAGQRVSHRWLQHAHIYTHSPHSDPDSVVAMLESYLLSLQLCSMVYGGCCATAGAAEEALKWSLVVCVCSFVVCAPCVECCSQLTSCSLTAKMYGGPAQTCWASACGACCRHPLLLTTITVCFWSSRLECTGRV